MPKYIGIGTSLKDPIVIEGVTTNSDAIDAEYKYLEKFFGQKQQGWRLVYQQLHRIDSQVIDELVIQLFNGRKISLYFNVTKYFGK